MQHRYITPFYSPILNVTIDVCEFLSGVNTNIATKWWFDMISEALPPGVLHECPYLGVSKFENIYVNASQFLISQFFVGNYKSTMTFFDDQDENGFTIFHDFLLSAVNDGKKKKKN